MIKIAQFLKENSKVTRSGAKVRNKIIEIVQNSYSKELNRKDKFKPELQTFAGTQGVTLFGTPGKRQSGTSFWISELAKSVSVPYLTIRIYPPKTKDEEGSFIFEESNKETKFTWDEEQKLYKKLNDFLNKYMDIKRAKKGI